MNPAEILLRASTRWLLIVLPLGVWIRSAFVWIYNPAPFLWSSLIHAHSHTAYFGWAGLGLMGLILYLLPNLTGRPVADSRPLRWLLRLAPLAVGGALITFAWMGYGPASIAFSALNEVLWFLFAMVFWREVRHQPLKRWPASLWMMGAAVCLLLLSTLGTVLVILARLVFDFPLLYHAGIYLFLQVYGDGWLEVGLMGAVLAIGGEQPQHRRVIGWVTLAFLLLMAPASLRLLAPNGLEGPLLTLGAVAGAGLGLAQLGYLWTVRGIAIPKPVRPWWLLAGGSLLVKAGMEFLPLLDNWSGLAMNRSLVISFLHLKLLLIVTSLLLGTVAMLRKAVHPISFWLFAGGSALMIGTLAVHGFWAQTDPALSKTLYLIAFVAAFPAATGGMWQAMLVPNVSRGLSIRKGEKYVRANDMPTQ